MAIRYLLFSACFMFIHNYGKAQTAALQIIHNSPDPDLALIDVYVNNEIVSADLAYHEATAFTTVNVEFGVELGLALSGSSGPADIMMVYDFSFVGGSSNTLVINGALSPEFQPLQPLSVYHSGQALQLATNPSGTTFNFFNGAFDTGTVDLEESELIQLPAFESVGYGDYTEYLELFTADYEFTLRNSVSDDAWASFDAPFAAYGWAGEAVTIVSSGFINQALNPDGDLISLWAATPSGGMMTPLPLTDLNLFAGVQFIHNAPDASLSFLDVMINGELVVDNLEFRNATGFLPVPAGEPIEVQFLNADGSALNTPYANSFNLIPGQSYYMVATGIVQSANYDPALPFDAMIIPGAKTIAENPNEVEISFIHASTDIGDIDVHESLLLNEVLFDNVQYSEFVSYEALPAQLYQLDVTNTAGTDVYGEFEADFSQLSGGAFALLASGFLTPEQNSGGAAFGLFLAPNNGGELWPLMPVPDVPEFSQVQLIHASADEALFAVDIYLDDVLVAENMAYPSATAFFEVQVNDPVVIEVFESGFTGDENLLFSQQVVIEANESIHLVLSGILSNNGYNPSPDAAFVVFGGAQTSAMNASECDIRFIHTSTDAGSMDISGLTGSQVMLAEGLIYGGVSDYVSVNTAENLGFEAVQGGGDFQFGQWEIPALAQDLAGEAVAIFAGGFFNTSNNSDGSLLSFYMVKQDGTVLPLEIYIGIGHMELNDQLQVFPNPANTSFRLVPVSGDQKIIAGRCELVVADITGKVIIHQFAGDFCNKEIDIAHLSDGYYSIQMINENNRWQAALVVKH